LGFHFGCLLVCSRTTFSTISNFVLAHSRDFSLFRLGVSFSVKSWLISINLIGKRLSPFLYGFQRVFIKFRWDYFLIPRVYLIFLLARFVIARVFLIIPPVRLVNPASFFCNPATSTYNPSSFHDNPATFILNPANGVILHFSAQKSSSTFVFRSSVQKGPYYLDLYKSNQHTNAKKDRHH
jgi:hypothetical protein